MSPSKLQLSALRMGRGKCFSNSVFSRTGRKAAHREVVAEGGLGWGVEGDFEPLLEVEKLQSAKSTKPILGPRVGIFSGAEGQGEGRPVVFIGAGKWRGGSILSKANG